MRNALTATTFICLGFIFVYSSDGGAPEALDQKEKDEGFVTLFNGVDLTGWKEVQGSPGVFAVKEGILVGKRDRTVHTAYWLSTAEKFHNFDLRLQYRLKKDGNSGVFIRVPHHRPRTSKQGMEIQLLDDAGRTGRPSDGDTGSIYRVVAASKYASKPAEQWNDLEISCHGDRVRVTLNGQLINDALMRDHELLRPRPREGFIGLSAHTDVVEFKNIRLRKLPDDAAETP